jgi:tetratricopeptide (TPR) repeat protein
LETLYRSGERLGAKPTVLAGLRLRISPDERERVIEELIGASSGTNMVLRREAVAFLAERNELVKALDLMPTNLVASDVRLHSARLQALLELGRTEQAAEEMSAAGELLAVEPHLRFCLQAQVAVKSDRRDQAARLLQQAVLASGQAPGPLRFCAIYAERLGFPKESISAYQKLADHPPATIMACRQVLRLAMASDNLVEAQLALRRASRFLPDDSVFLVGSVYLDLLMGQRSGQERLSSVEEVLATRPRDAFTRATVALGRWRAGNVSGAVAVLEEGGVDWEKAEPRCRAVRAAILGANLQREAARQIVRTLDVDRLMSAERMLVEEWR